ncbi:hypothetical protein SUGI_0768240 [Cryptomeria japonica]|uniref:uncharacterized protein LOC131033078 n=1 Tax=Cryptomeria japonica TaxID=3369 RepID=UPI002414A309|nr:uncharacterized protein LOC131033078 [Cryptomeria japonica]GLJ37795.1 hypothetical protein SUGI_0768240 [Cryptomeria japonica]
MAHRKRETPGKTPKNKSGKLKIVEEEEIAQESTQYAGEDAMQISPEIERNRCADQNGAEKAEVDQKVAGAAEANDVNREETSMEPKSPEKMVSAKKNRKKNAAKLVDGAKIAGSLAAETVDIDKLAAEPKSDLIVATESKNEEIVADKPKSEENVQGEQKNEEIVDSKQTIVKSEQKGVQNSKFEMKSPQKEKDEQKVLGDTKADEANTEKLERQPNKSEKVESEQKDLHTRQKTTGEVEGDAAMNNVDKLEVGYASTTKNDRQQENGMRKTQLKKLRKLQGLEYWGKTEAEEKSAAMVEENHSKKVDEDTMSEKVEVEAKNSDKVGPEKKSVEGVKSEVVRQVEAEHKYAGTVEGEVVTPAESQKKSTENVEAQENNSICKKQMKKLVRLEAKQSREKAEAEKESTVRAVTEDKNMEKNADAKNSEKARPEKKTIEMAGSGSEKKKFEGVKGEVIRPVEAERKSSENGDAQQNNGLTKRQRKRLRQLEEFKTLEKAEMKEDDSLSGQLNWMFKKMEHDKKIGVKSKNADKAESEKNSVEGVKSEVVKQVKAEDEHAEAVPAETEQKSTEMVDAQQNNSISKKQTKKLVTLEVEKSREKAEAEKKSTVIAVAEDTNLEKNADPKISEKAQPEKKNVETAGSGSEKKKLEGVKGEVVKQVEAERKSTANGDAQQNNGLTKRQRKRLRQLEQLNNLEKAEMEDNGLSGQQNWMLKKLEHNKQAVEEIEVIVKTETKVTEKAETKQKLSEKMEIDGTVEKKLENEQSKGKRKKSKKRKRANTEKGGELNKITEEEGEGKKITQDEVVKKTAEEEGQTKKIKDEEGEGKKITQKGVKKTTEEEGQTKKITKKVGEVKKTTQGLGQVKTMEIDGTVEKKPENDQRESKKRNGANIEKEGQVKKTRQEEIATKKEQKQSDATQVIEMLVDSLSKDELSEALKLAAQQNPGVLRHINRVASRDRSKRTIYVGNLSHDTNSNMLRKVFSRYGKIRDARAISDKQSGECKGYGFVIFATKSSALNALTNPTKEINGQQSHCSEFRDKSSIDSDFVNPALHGPGGVVNPTMLGPGGYGSPTVFGPRVNSTFSGHLNPHAVLGGFQSQNQWGHPNLQYEYSDSQYNEIERVERCGCGSIYCDL